MKINTFNFKKALPVWQDGAEKVMNRTLLFKYSLDGTFKKDCSLSIAASSSFIVSVNGNIIAKGPARCAHGYYMVDTYSLDSLLEASENLIEIKVSGYNVNSFEYLNQPSFICAEIVSDGKVIAYTDEVCVGFIPYVYTDRIEKVQRYSFQRAFTEAYRLGGKELPIAKLSATDKKNFIERDIPYGDYALLYPSDKIEKGCFSYSDKERYYNSREICGISDIFFGYRPEELEFTSHINVGKMDFTPTDLNCALSFPLTLKSENYIDLDMKKNYTGLISIELECLSDGILYLLFDEIKNDGILNPFRLGCSNIVSLCCNKGSYSLVTEEAYVMQYLRLCASSGDFIIKDVHLIEIAFPESKISARFISDDTEMKKIYDAAKESFKANTVDIFMDCPSRERAGWLCDSFFTARCESILTGEFSVEKAFLRNFILPDKFEFIPSGMLPMCYPSDHNDGVFIPNWAMWYGIELCEYYERSGDLDLVLDAKNRIYALLDYFSRFENEYSLLENLESWIFIEWSKSNDLVRDVSFGTNMLYSYLLKRIGALYGDNSLKEKAEKIKNAVNELSMTESGFYCDNAIRRDGKLVLSGERTESVQYYAFFCDIATPDDHEWLWTTLVNDFGYDRQTTGKYPEIYPANAFIGNYLRLELLNRYGYKDALYDNILGYFTYMAEKTGTLWENTGDYASCNHGFASHVIYWMKSLGLIK